MKEYQTQQRKRLLDFFAGHPDRQFAVEEISRAIDGVSISAIYRNIHDLLETGFVRRFQQDSSRKFLYQYFGENCAEHLHMKCSRCGTILHTDPKVLELLEKMVSQRNNFRLDKHNTILLGSCKACQ